MKTRMIQCSLTLFMFMITLNAKAQIDLTSPVEFKHYIGELYGGGIVAAVWIKDGKETGLIVSLKDLSSECIWSNISDRIFESKELSLMDGKANTDMIIQQKGHIKSAAKLCRDYDAGGFKDWYFPSLRELQLCFQSVYIINDILGDDGFKPERYWTSSEQNNSAALMCEFGERNPNTGVSFSGGHPGGALKKYKYYVRAIRRF